MINVEGFFLRWVNTFSCLVALLFSTGRKFDVTTQEMTFTQLRLKSLSLPMILSQCLDGCGCMNGRMLAAFIFWQRFVRPFLLMLLLPFHKIASEISSVVAESTMWGGRLGKEFQLTRFWEFLFLCLGQHGSLKWPRGRPYMTSAKFSGFLTLSPLVHNLDWYSTKSTQSPLLHLF